MVLPLGEWYFVKAAGLFSLVMLIAIGRLRAHHPFSTLGVANQVTTVRAVLAVCVGSLIGEPGIPPVAMTVVAAALSATALDGVDGWLARRTRVASAFGARFDVEVDALLIQSLAVLCWQHDKAGPWVLLSGLIRYAFVAAGWLWPWMRQPLTPSLRGRVICVVQIAALMRAIVPAIAPPYSATIAALGLLALCYSFLIDTVWLWRHADKVLTSQF